MLRWTLGLGRGVSSFSSPALGLHGLYVGGDVGLAKGAVFAFRHY